jgi:tRNA pseudouridine38-40 synthase
MPCPQARAGLNAALRTFLEYDGTPFVGWQRQINGLSVQQVLEEAGAPLNGGALPETVASGRTDAGVHAEGQVVHIDLALDLPPERLREALNTRSRPHPVSVVSVARAPAGWSARFSAQGRAYRYRILNRRAAPGAGGRPRLACAAGAGRRRDARGGADAAGQA